MATLLRPVGHEDRLSLVEHLDELRTRLIVSLAAFLACFAVCFWQNGALLDVMNRPLERAKQAGTGTDTFEQSGIYDKALADLATELAKWDDVPPAVRAAAENVVKLTPKATPRKPITTGVGEPFFTTFKVAAYAALFLALPVLLWQLYAFVIPAFSPHERRVALPLMSLVPFLFFAGAAFAYFVVLPSAVKFLQNFNDDDFDILLQARDYYQFSIMVLIAMGSLFQIPVAILLLTRAEIVTVQQLRANRRYAILIIAVLAMLLPGTDPVTMLLAMAPLAVLYEGSILLSALLARRSQRTFDEDD